MKTMYMYVYMYMVWGATVQPILQFDANINLVYM